MKFLVLLKNVMLDVNGGEYSATVYEPLFLGIIEADSEEIANKKAEILAQECYNNYGGGAYALEYPYLSVEKI